MTLEEALLNAMYHGNLELEPIVRETNLNLYHSLAESRLTQSPYRDRVISVRVGQTDDMVSWEIADDGNGFEFAPFLEAESTSILERSYGRGIMLMRTVMDEVVFNSTGNAVFLTKYRSSLASDASRARFRRG